MNKWMLPLDIRFWNNSKKQSEIRYLASEFLSRPNAENLVNLFSSATKHLDQRNLLHRSVDALQSIGMF